MSEEINDPTDGDSKTGSNIKAFISQFETKPIKLFPKPTPALNKPIIQPKPQPKPKNGFAGVPTQSMLSKVSLKPVEPKTHDTAQGDSNGSKKAAIVPPLVPKTLVDKENKPPSLDKPPLDKPNCASPATNAAGPSIAELKNRLKVTQPNPGPIPAKKEPQPKPEPVRRKPNPPVEPEYSGDKVYTSPTGQKYRALQMPSKSGNAPKKPSVPPNVDLYDFQMEVAEDDELYEAYNDVELPSKNVVRAVSMIPDMSAEDEESEMPQQEEYTDTEVPGTKERPLSLQDEEFYEPLDELP